MSDSMRGGRRSFLGAASAIAMTGGLAAGYGTFAAMAGRFLYPASTGATTWQFVADVATFADGASIPFRTPAGEKVAIARRGTSGKADDFVALSSTCPHLGCQVHFEPQNNRFFCPCHNGAFDPTGKATEGPPAEAGQSLLRFPLEVRDGLLYIAVPVDRVTKPDKPGVVSRGERPSAPGKDPCLDAPFPGEPA